MVIGLQLDLTLLQQLAGFLRRAGPALEQHLAEDGPLLRAAHALPLDWRAGVEHHAVLDPGDDLPGGRNVYKHRLPRAQAPGGFLIGLFYLLFNVHTVLPGLECPWRAGID